MVKKKRIPWNKGKKGVTEETRKKMSEAKKGKKRPPLSEEHKRKMSLARKGMKFSLSHKRNLSLAKKGQIPHNKGKKISDKQKRKQSQSMKKFYSRGGRHPMKGKKQTEEAKRKMSEKKSGSNHPNYGKHLPKSTRDEIGSSNKLTAKQFWNSLSESQKKKTRSAKTWFKKGQASHNKGKIGAPLEAVLDHLIPLFRK